MGGIHRLQGQEADAGKATVPTPNPSHAAHARSSAYLGLGFLLHKGRLNKDIASSAWSQKPASGRTVSVAVSCVFQNSALTDISGWGWQGGSLLLEIGPSSLPAPATGPCAQQALGCDFMHCIGWSCGFRQALQRAAGREGPSVFPSGCVPGGVRSSAMSSLCSCPASDSPDSPTPSQGLNIRSEPVGDKVGEHWFGQNNHSQGFGAGTSQQHELAPCTCQEHRLLTHGASFAWLQPALGVPAHQTSQLSLKFSWPRWRRQRPKQRGAQVQGHAGRPLSSKAGHTQDPNS